MRSLGQYDRRSLVRLAGVGTVLMIGVAGGCRTEHIPLPMPLSGPQPFSPTLQAGVHRVDITPPPGYGLFGYGTEGRKATGFRTRLYARALVLHGVNDELVAFVVCDLDVISTLLHRKVAEKVKQATESAIGADRLFLSATHTHSAPGHYLSAWTLNAFGSSVMGYDAAFSEWLSTRIAAAVDTAFHRMAPAQAGWATTNVWGHTRNRSYEAYRLNSGVPAFEITPPDLVLDERYQAVNPRWSMLRVDIQDETGSYEPRAALSIFAIHGTGIPSGNELYDADIHGQVARGLEGDFRPGFVHLFANGAAGDVSPAWPPETRCAAMKMLKEHRPGGPRVPPAKDDWHDLPPTRREACLTAAKSYVRYVGQALADSAARIFGDLADSLRSDVVVTRNFDTLHLTSLLGSEVGLCERGEAGTATAAGAPDGQSRFTGWKFLGLFSLGIEAGGEAVAEERSHCQAPKRALLGQFQRQLTGRLGWPSSTQVAVVRVGDMLVATVPGEPTTVVGLRLMAAIRDVKPDDVPADNIAIMGFTNGDLRYITTQEEYAAQYYEGGSNLYGPATAGVLGDRLAQLVAALPAQGASASPAVAVDTIWVEPGKDEKIEPAQGERPATLHVERALCDGAAWIVRWYDAAPGSLRVEQGPLIQFRASDGTVVPDGDLDTEVRYLGRRGGNHLWEARWIPPGGTLYGTQVDVQWLRWSDQQPEIIKCVPVG